MPGTYVRDANASNLLSGATLNSAGSTNATAVEVSKPGNVRVRLATSTVTGTNPTIEVELKGADDSGFTTNVVSYGKFGITTGNAAAQSNVTKFFEADVRKRYVRATVVLGGTSPVYTGATCTLELPEDHANYFVDSAY